MHIMEVMFFLSKKQICDLHKISGTSLALCWFKWGKTLPLKRDQLDTSIENIEITLE